MASSSKLFPVASKKPPYTVPVPNYEKKEGEGVPRRHPVAVDGLKTTPDPSISTVYDIVTYAANTHGTAECMGTRQLIKTHNEEKMVKKIVNGEETEVPKKWTYYELGPYKFINFVEYKDLVDSAGAGLRALGLAKGSRIHIMAATSQRWITIAHASASQSMSIVTSYDTLGEQGLTHSLEQAGSEAIFLDSDLLVKLKNPLNKAPKLKYVIYNAENHDLKQADIDYLKTNFERLTILSFEDLVEMGKNNPTEVVLPDPDDLCCIMYTSGSTGPPKGVPLKHKSVVAGVAGVSTCIAPHLKVGDYVLNFLPLAHILELVFENAIIVWGAAMGYGSPRTLSDRAMRNCKGDIRELKPTILVAVPAVWETVKKGIMDNVSKQSAFKQKLFWGAMALKGMLLQAGLPGVTMLDNVVFKKIKEATGGRMKLCMNGGGPISKETHYFISMAICPMIMGYGLTETTAQCCVMDPYEWDNNTLGNLTSSIEVKLVDFPDAGYFTNNKPEQGEIWIRGAPVADSYYMDDEETAASFEDGWFKTGDIGEWDDKGNLSIIDRKKNLVKTLAGEYIALEKLESIYRSCPAVANILVYADSQQSKPVAVIVPNEPILLKLAKENGLKAEHVEEIIHDQKLIKIVHDQLLATGKKGGLGGIELIQGVVLTEEEWTPQNNLVTSAQKLNRKGIVQKHKEEIDQAYGTA